MGKVITVWGSPGSGKSMFCCILAKALTRDKRKAIIINADMNVPMLPVWLPEQAEFEAAMQYHSESDIQEAYGWEFISEQQYERYLELFRQGRKALDEHSPTVTELALSILNRIFQDIDRDCRQCEFEALSPEEQLAELKRAEESKQAWRQYIASLKEMVGSAAAQE